MNQFVDWNLLLLQHFFGPGREGVDVWFDATPEEIDFVIGIVVGGRSGLVEAVREGPPWPTFNFQGRYLRRSRTNELVECAKGLLEQRSEPALRPASYIDPGTLDLAYAGTNAPTYLPILALMTSTAALSGGGFYERLNRDLDPSWDGSQATAIVSSGVPMQALNALWSDLSAWANACDGRFGSLRSGVLGGFRLIGVPRSQVIFSAMDCDRISRAFYVLGWQRGRNISESEMNHLREYVRDGGATYLSTALRDAVLDDDFVAPVRERLSELLNEWDGTVYEPPQHGAVGNGGSGGSGAGGPGTVREAPPIPAGLALLVEFPAGGEPEIHLGVAIPPLGAFVPSALRVGRAEWMVNPLANSLTIALPDPSQQAAAWRTLADESLERTRLEVVGVDWGEADEGRFVYGSLARGELRCFVCRTTTSLPDRRTCVLVEQEAPSPDHPTFLLVPADHAAGMDHLCRLEGVHAEVYSFSGLPEGWTLRRVDDAVTLCRVFNKLPGASGSTNQPRRLRLLGGTRIRRAGSQFFKSYDLPLVEVDASEKFHLDAENLTAVPLNPLDPSERDLVTDVFVGSGRVRQYRLEREGHAGVGRITLRDASGRLVEQAPPIRILPDDLARHGSTDLLRVDDLGVRAANGIPSVSGFDLDADLTPIEWEPFVVASVGRAASEDDLEYLLRSPSLKLRDLLTARGPMRAADLRRFLHRQLPATQQQAFATYDLLRTAWMTGVVEVEMDAKGRWEWVFPVPRMLYRTMVEQEDGSAVGAFAGSWSRAEWQQVYATSRGSARLVVVPGWEGSTVQPRIVAPDLQGLVSFASALGVPYVESPAPRLATWMAGLDRLDEIWRGTLRDQVLPENPDNPLHYFRPEHAQYLKNAGQGHAGSILARAIDPQTGRTEVHAICMRREHDHGWSFVRDRWWGRWHALRSTAQFFAETHNDPTLQPWPIPYVAEIGSIWLPAILDLPLLAARTAVSCSGLMPEYHDVRGEPRPDGRYDVFTAQGAVALLSASRVYERYLTTSRSTPRWVVYRWVPQGVAEQLALKLGGRLDPSTPRR